MSWYRLLLAAFLISQLSQPASLLAQPDDVHGLWARYVSHKGGTTRSVDRIEPDISFDWGSGSPAAVIPDGEFSAEWIGKVLVREAATYQLHAYIQGDVTIHLGNHRLRGQNDFPAWISSSPRRMDFGEKKLWVEFTKTAPKAVLKLYWSSDAFPLEPISPQQLFVGPAELDQWEALDQVARGQDHFEAARCAACHRRQNVDVLSAPSLSSIITGTSRAWLEHKIANPHVRVKSASDKSHSPNMPHFGFTADEAESISAFLLSNSKQADLLKPHKLKKPADAPKEGELLFRSLGCLACHTLGALGKSDQFGGGPLDRIGDKRTRDWIETWLADPKRMNPKHRMPTFKLSPTERGQLAIYLSQQATQQEELQTDDSAESIANGKKLLMAARCSSCHAIDGIEATDEFLTDLSELPAKWDNSCLSESPDRKRMRPAFPNVDADAVRAFLKSQPGKLSKPGPQAIGERALRTKGCLACHSRGTTKGIVEVAGLVSRKDDRLTGQSEGLIPPSLTAIGDKLQDKALLEAISGDQKSVRLPWLFVRMPRFSHSESVKAAVAAALINHDRIPQLPEQLSPKIHNAPAEDVVIAGHDLLSTKGFSCIACHKVGSYEPKKVALGTRGSDLLLMAGRLRKDYFMRWTRSAIRIVPGMEMPSLKKPVPNVLGEHLETQLSAIWDAVQSPKFVVPTNPSVVEQFWTVDADQPARIVRDVFAESDRLGTTPVARSFAVGLNNGHNVLFDMDQASIVQWTFGDFARQRTVGKSWYWDMAGVPLVKGFRRSHVWASVPSNDKFGSPTSASAIKLRDYQPQADGVSVNYEVTFPTGKAVVNEEISPWNSDVLERTGWDRTITFRVAEGDIRPAIRVPRPSAEIGKPAIDVAQFDGKVWAWVVRGATPGTPPEYVLPALDQNSNTYRIKMRFVATLEPSHLPVKPRPIPPPSSETITTMPGFDGVRLPINPTVMPTAITWLADGTMAFTSLKGHVYLARDTDGDGLEDQVKLFEEGLAAPFGITTTGDEIIVAHKPEVIGLTDTDGDGRADKRRVIASGWGYTDNYHDWASGCVQDSRGQLYVALGSDYAQKSRPKDQARWRGTVLRIDPKKSTVVPIAHALRYPIGLAINRDDQVFATDNQGVQNTFNEINHIIDGRHYGVPKRYEPNPDAAETRATIQVPHPMTRSVNGVLFIPERSVPELADHAIGCEYDSRFLARFSFQDVGGQLQGATYYLSQPNSGVGGKNFLGPMCGAVHKNGDIYIGSIHDSGWLGGPNHGGIVRLRRNKQPMPNGIREIRAVKDGFEVEFFSWINSKLAKDPKSYSVSGYTRVWKGGYGTPDSGRHTVDVKSAKVSADGKTVTLEVGELRPKHVYDIACGKLDDKQPLWPASGHYTMNRVP